MTSTPDGMPGRHRDGPVRPWSCDTFFVAPDRAAGGDAIFAKNSDRPAGETQPLRHFQRRSGGGDLTLAYVTIPDVPTTAAHLGASPYWCWGHELGVNEHGVAIGNEALFTRAVAAGIAAERDGNPPEAGILGMELLRIGLERSATADEALDVMTSLLTRYGQWGSGVGGRRPEDGAYDNAFVVADPAGAWVLETSGREWAARRVMSGTYSISNQPTIRDAGDRCSAGLRTQATAARWWPADADGFDSPAQSQTR
ncbi:C69 family dipeptidase [Leifsonia sp. McL0607]|uniref:C69 family dipeptidase n=1 Tax=Leifsonia sp. McL0607 TaxID=3415672 RepID=UPI003CED4680